MAPSIPSSLPKTLPPDAITLGLGFQQMNLGGTQTFLYNSHAMGFGGASDRRWGGTGQRRIPWGRGQLKHVLGPVL